MELHGTNPLKNVIAIIPARYASTRLPGKLLRDIAGRPLILHTLEQAKKAQTVSRVIVATDDERIFRHVTDAGGEAVMTSADHQSGSDRIAEVARDLSRDSIIVNVQGDEPLIAPETIDKAVDALVKDDGADIVTVCETITDQADVISPNVVKVVTDEAGYALYFSRSPIPFPRAAKGRFGDWGHALVAEPGLIEQYKKHCGLYVYRRDYLMRLNAMPQSRLEQLEMLEQLRALEKGARIRVVETDEASIGVDTLDDLMRVSSIIEARSITLRPAGKEDIPAIARVYVDSVRSSFAGIEPESYLNGLTAEDRERALSERFDAQTYSSFVAEDSRSGIVGSIDCGKPVLDEQPHDRQVFSFYLLPQFQRKGVGSRLFKKCIDQIVEDGCTSVCLDTLAANPYRGFYEKAGGAIIGKGTHRIEDKLFETVIYGWKDLRTL